MTVREFLHRGYKEGRGTTLVMNGAEPSGLWIHPDALALLVDVPALVAAMRRRSE